MSLKNNEGKLFGWKHHCGNTKLQLHSTQAIKDKMYVRLFNMLREEVISRYIGNEKNPNGEEQLKFLLTLGPKKLWKMEMLKTTGGRRGYTKQK